MFKRLLGSQETGNRKRSKSCRPRVEWMEPRTLLSAVTWTGDGGDNNWDTAANWSTDSVPGSGDDVTINIAANVVHSNNVTDSINSLTSTEPSTISGGTLSIAAASTIRQHPLDHRRHPDRRGQRERQRPRDSDRPARSPGSSELNANGGMLINPIGARPRPSIFDGRTVNNAAGQTATWTGSDNSYIVVSDGSVFNNLGTFSAEALGLTTIPGTGAASSFVDKGTLHHDPESAIAEFQVPFNVPGGSVDVQDQQHLDTRRGGTSTGGAFNLDQAAILDRQRRHTHSTRPRPSAAPVAVNVMVSPSPHGLTRDLHIHGRHQPHGANLQVDGSIAGSAVNIVEGTLSGTGTVGSITRRRRHVSPGDGAGPGILNVQGDVDFER